jgi:L-2-hydroxyglutarate oxidase LhgO
MSDFDVAIIGAGVIGLASAAALASNQRSVVVLERNSRPGQETSSRNSGVIHAGLYYPPGSLKAVTCVEGREQLYERCAARDIAHRKTGKLLVATDEAEEKKLSEILERARQNGAGELRWLERAEIKRLEPAVEARSGLWSPESGIVDVHELMYSYQKQARDGGALFVFQTEVQRLEREATGWRLTTLSAGTSPATLCARVVINAAGLFADRIAQAAGLDIDALGYRYRWCKGDYFALTPELRGLVTHLVYPVPVHAGLGVHVTFDLGGKLTLGPDTEYVSELGYRVDPSKRALFAAAARRYLPGIRDEQLTADYAGIRPKLQGPGEPFRDFVIEDAATHGKPGLINLIGVESPGVTASSAIAARAAALVGAAS